MAYDRASALALHRRVTHDVMAIAWDYTDSEIISPVELRVRWSNKSAAVGNLAFQGYTEMAEGIDTVIFDRDELAEKGINLQRGGALTGQVGGPFEGAVLRLDSQLPDTGPINRTWRVVLP